MSGFFIVPSVLFDRSIYPRCFGQSENALRLYIYECARINNSGFHYAGPKAAKKCLGLNNSEYSQLHEELVKNHFVFRYYPSNQNKKLKLWGIHNPPLMEFSDIRNIQYLITGSEPQSGKSARFHSKSIPYKFIRVPSNFASIPKTNIERSSQRPLVLMSVDEIYCYINILWQNRECWFGVNPNYVRYNLSLDRFQQADFELTDFMSPKVEWGDKLYVDPVFIERTHISRYALESILYSLVERYRLFNWAIWIACPVTYYERRRSINSTSLKLVSLLDFNRNNVSRAEILIKAKEVFEADESKLLIATLQSCLNLNPEFKKVIEYNCSRLSISNLIRHDQSRYRYT